MKKISTLAACCFAVSSAWGLQEPERSPLDHRIRYVDYNPHDVVQMESVIGISTHIVTSPDEEYITHAFGDSASYEFGTKQNHYFIKPIAEQADTNLSIVTTKRTYAMRLRFRDDRLNATYKLTFRYPEEEQRKKEAAEALKRAELEAEAKRKKAAEDMKYTAYDYNLEYTMSGDLSIAPINAWDDGRFTYFKFAQHVDLPLIYAINQDGQESIVNRHMLNDQVIVMHQVREKWVLRLGDNALAVWNEMPQSERWELFETGTVSERVERKVKGEQ